MEIHLNKEHSAMLSKLHSFCQKALRLIALCAAALILAGNLYYQVEVSYDGLELVSISRSIVYNLQILLITAGMAALFCLFRRMIRNIRPGHLFTGLSLIYLLFSAYLIPNATNVLRSDAKSVFSCALLVKNGDYSVFQPTQYLNMYPHQIGMMLFDLLLSVVSENPSFLFSVNSMMVLGINFTTWQISRLLWQDENIHLLTILLSFMFLPQLFFIMFAYGQIPGLLFLLISIDHTIRYAREHRAGNLLCLCLSLAVSVLLRKNNLIGACAICIFLMVDFLRQRNPRMLFAAICLIASLILSDKAVLSFFEAKSETPLDNGCPAVLWVAMGTDIDNHVRCAGWYDHSSYTIYLEAQANADAAAAQGFAKLSQNVEKMRLRPIETVWFFKNKIVSQWCEPMYQSVWSGPMLKDTQETYTAFLQSLYSGGDVENAFEAYCKCVSMLLWVGVLVYLLACGKHSGWEIAFSYFVGGFLFHIFWEGKSQYIYPYVFCLIPFAACGVHACLTHKRKKDTGLD